MREGGPDPLTDPQPPSLREAFGVWLKIGLLSLGGPAGQIAMMHRVLVEERRWIGERRFLHALNYCMLLPGPEAQQLATYVGWLMHRTAGGLIAGVLFIAPGALVMLSLSMAYALFGQTPLAAGLFFCVKAAVLAVVAEAILRIGRRALKSRSMLALAVAAFIAIWAFQVPFPLIVLGAGLAGWALDRHLPEGAHGTEPTDDPGGLIDAMFARGELEHTRPRPGRWIRVLGLWGGLWLAPLALLVLILGPDSVWTRIAAFFSTMGVVTFGGAYAVLSYVAQAAVSGFGWLSPGEMADGLGLAETTPGPLILVLQFVGFLAAWRDAGPLPPLLAGALGALLTTWVTFAPSFLWIFLGGPYVEQLRDNRALRAALSAITAAVVGVIANLALWFGLHTLFRQSWPAKLYGVGPDLPVLASANLPAIGLAAAATVAMLRFKVGMGPTLIACAIAGVAISGLST
ncbi:chromate efflux transporter [Phenylobacterium sp.]|uniref:chromate efflux transporter n=1 Tax=Phenylobacterium sp. TaxID=1871053 RepID=UPI0035B101DF